ncbi:bifunctional protein-serine/threonine kinase/phosphatase [Spartinivicinus marinus]|uniref:bifunctional protein-serine/threonine kinase/phosphatase n=1 Tax=Spartinivicinus marinus TaxID=2994442 RepID=UPI001C5C867C|nr:bifunctional protein-serine/threonine kinase/phosphatase [Spartinivicinus marinus]MCX4025769.1 bifunctional protein-serine/threonine kinase/phosphatase [Spartinivicinus marinus]
MEYDSYTSLVVNVGGYSCAGKQAQNQDAFAALSPTNSDKYYKGVVGCIADGASGCAQAKLASQLAVTQFIEDYYCTPASWPVKTAGAKVLSALNHWLYHHSQQHTHNQALLTTFTAVVIKSTTAYLFHAGDSRLYHIRQQQVEQLTRDHRLFQGKQSYLSQAMGAALHIEMDYQQLDVQQGDIFILTTDGVHDVLTEQMLVQHLSQTEYSLEVQAKNIVQQALAQGSSDNLSCLLLQVAQLPNENLSEAQNKLQQQVIPPVLQPGMKIDGYEVKSLLHNSSRSHLYLVQSLQTDEKCVLKAPSLNFAEDIQYLENFAREQWVARRINHPNLIKGLTKPDSSQFQYLLYEYVEGQTLRQWMYDNPKPTLEQVRQLAKSIIKPLRALQRLHMVHRDLKPDNIMLDQQGEIKLIDLGAIAVKGLTELGAFNNAEKEYPQGSADYIAPEYLLDNSYSYLTDLFSLAVMVYEILTGELPFKIAKYPYQKPKNYQAWQYRSLREKRVDIPLWFDLALKKALSPNPAKRYQSFSEFYHDLCTPNRSLISQHQQQPLIKRYPVRFWQVLSSVLFILLVAQVVS